MIVLEQRYRVHVASRSICGELPTLPAADDVMRGHVQILAARRFPARAAQATGPAVRAAARYQR